MAKISMRTKEPSPKKSKVQSTKKELDILSEINKYRTENKLKPLGTSKYLEAVAMARAVHIYNNDDFSHSPKNGAKYSDLVDGTKYSYVGENLARKFKKKENMIQAWKDSPTHNKNILEDYDDTGIATYNDVTVQIFGRKTK